MQRLDELLAFGQGHGLVPGARFDDVEACAAQQLGQTGRDVKVDAGLVAQPGRNGAGVRAAVAGVDQNGLGA